MKKVIILAVSLLTGVLVFGINSFFNKHKKDTLGSDYKIERVDSEIRLLDYAPFSNSRYLYNFEKEPGLIISEDYPRLDGATAAYPVYSTVVQGVYKGLDKNSVKEYVECNTTPKAYDRLINNEVDAIFVAEPSKKQLEKAKNSNVELEMIPIAKEAFIFFVNKKNKVNNLSVEQIQDIYTKKITNWKQVGGKSNKILAFQRPENSGSQTVMENKVMKNIKMAEPIKEEYHQMMGGIIQGVADYRNYKEAVGYSFRFYASGMKKNDNIKLLSVNGVEPTIENIASEKYPYTVNVYLVKRKDNKNKNLDSLIEWILSEEGQNVINEIGYVSIK